MQFSSVSAALARVFCLIGAVLALAACSTMSLPDAPGTIGEAAKPHYKIGAPYKIDGKWYVPKIDEAYDAVGVASWYGDAFHRKLTANGEIFDKGRISAAHKTLPLPTLVEVQNLENGRRIVVRVNDRGPFVDDRIIDLSHAAADQLGFAAKGLARVRVRYVGEADLSKLAARPGDAATRPGNIAAIKPAASSDPEIGAEPDPLGALIAANTDEVRSPAPAVAPVLASVSPPQDIWVELAKLDDLSTLQSMDLNMPDLGPITVQAEHGGEKVRQSLRIGPFISEAIALASLTRVQAAGFGSARIVRGAGG